MATISDSGGQSAEQGKLDIYTTIVGYTNNCRPLSACNHFQREQSEIAVWPREIHHSATNWRRTKTRQASSGLRAPWSLNKCHRTTMTPYLAIYVWSCRLMTPDHPVLGLRTPGALLPRHEETVK